MRKAKSIFGSDPEGKAFQSIALHLPAGWQVYPNLPLSLLVRVGKHELTPPEWDLYLKTSVDFTVDFTLVKGGEAPSLVIEFDGMGGGFSSSDQYVQVRSTTDANRGAKLDFKLRICQSVDLPMIITSFDEMIPSTPDGELSILNSIAAQHVATRTYKVTVSEWDADGRGIGKSWDERMWDLADLDAETQCELDPFLKRLSKSWDRFAESGVQFSWRPLFKPDVLTTMRAGKAFESVGCQFTAKGGGLTQPVVSTVWVRNWAGDELSGLLTVDCPVKSGINPLRVAENIARCIGHEAVLAQLAAADATTDSCPT